MRNLYRTLWVLAIGFAVATVGLSALGFECPGHPADIGVEHEIDHHRENERNRDSYDRVESYYQDRDNAHDGGRSRDRPSSDDYHRAESWFRDNVI